MAKVIGVEGMDEKLKDVKVHGMYTRANPSPTFGFEPEIQACYFPGFINKDVAFLHTADAGTLIEADLLFNTPGHGEQYSKAAPGLVQKLAAGLSKSDFEYPILTWNRSYDRSSSSQQAPSVLPQHDLAAEGVSRV